MSHVELLEMQGDPLPLVLLALVLALLCIAWAFGVPQLLRDVHRSRMAVVRRHNGGPVRYRLAWLNPRHDGKDSSWRHGA